MSATAPLSKLAELRAKTDKDLVSILDNGLELGLLIAATDMHVDSAGRLHGRAEGGRSRARARRLPRLGP